MRFGEELLDKRQGVDQEEIGGPAGGQQQRVASAYFVPRPQTGRHFQSGSADYGGGLLEGRRTTTAVSTRDVTDNLVPAAQPSVRRSLRWAARPDLSSRAIV